MKKYLILVIATLLLLSCSKKRKIKELLFYGLDGVKIKDLSRTLFVVVTKDALYVGGEKIIKFSSEKELSSTDQTKLKEIFVLARCGISGGKSLSGGSWIQQFPNIKLPVTDNSHCSFENTFSGDIAIMADDDTPMRLIDTIIYQAQHAGFNGVRVVVQQNNNKDAYTLFSLNEYTNLSVLSGIFRQGDRYKKLKDNSVLKPKSIKDIKPRMGRSGARLPCIKGPTWKGQPNTQTLHKWGYYDRMRPRSYRNRSFCDYDTLVTLLITREKIVFAGTPFEKFSELLSDSYFSIKLDRGDFSPEKLLNTVFENYFKKVFRKGTNTPLSGHFSHPSYLSLFIDDDVGFGLFKEVILSLRTVPKNSSIYPGNYSPCMFKNPLPPQMPGAVTVYPIHVKGHCMLPYIQLMVHGSVKSIYESVKKNVPEKR